MNKPEQEAETRRPSGLPEESAVTTTQDKTLGPARLVMVIHNHQPVGNFDFVFEQAVDRSYAPFVDLLAEHPSVRVGLHFTGCLLEWLESHKPEMISTVREMVERNQVEILGGGWAEPMLAVLPGRDAMGQIRLMAAECARLFGSRPRGMWLAERVWDPDLPRILRKAGVMYTLLDDTHFRHAGLLEPRLTGHYVTEKAGHALAVFPIDRQLRYAIPFKEPEEAVKAIASVGAGKTVTYGDDGEKFGIWPETYEWVWEKGWLKRFFAAVTAEQSGVELLLPSEQIARHDVSGRVYLPTASYHEMGEWTLSPEAGQQLLDLKKALAAQELTEKAEPFVHGGIWMGFLSKYSESNILHKKMLRVSDRVDEAVQSGAPEAEAARRALYRGQCNCPYWHGLFGGLYLPHLRHAVYRQLVQAESLVDEGQEARLTVGDFDGDLKEEAFLDAPGMTAWVSPSQGGQLLALDDKARCVALAHVLTRRLETYHSQLLGKGDHEGGEEADDGPVSPHDAIRAKTPGLADRLVYDHYDRRVLVDHLLPAGADLTAICGAESYEPLLSLVDLAYEVVSQTCEGGRAELQLLGEQAIAESQAKLVVSKTFVLESPATLSVAYELRVKGELPESIQATFVVESSFALVPGDDTQFVITLKEPARRATAASPMEKGTWPEATAVVAGSSLENSHVGINVEPSAELWRFPIETVSQSEDGAELVYQGTTLAQVWRIELTGEGEPHRFCVRFRLD